MKDLCTCILLASVVGFLIYLHSLHIFYHTLTCTLHVYEPTVRPAAGCSQFRDIQVVTLLLKKFTCLHMQISAIPLPSQAHILQQYL